MKKSEIRLKSENLHLCKSNFSGVVMKLEKGSKECFLSKMKPHNKKYNHVPSN